MTQKTVLITGIGGLVGSATAHAFYAAGWRIVGIDNDSRAAFFGGGASVARGAPIARRADALHATMHSVDITNEQGVALAFKSSMPDAVVHAAAQPSHDKAAEIPLRDFDVNARGTLILLEAARRYCPAAPFLFLSTNKVYGDRPNRVESIEKTMRYEWPTIFGRQIGWGEAESTGGAIDHTTHSLFGCSKAAADLYVQEYGRYFGMPTVALRAGCLTGGAHAGAEQHGFLAYLARCIVRGAVYRVYGYGGKQVRDNLHADDVAHLLLTMADRPPPPGSVYNIGGGYENSCSVLEAARDLGILAGTPALLEMGRDGEAYPVRKGDHRVYYTNLEKVRAAYPEWCVSRSLIGIYEELVSAAKKAVA